MGRVIYIPKGLETKLVSLTNYVEEVNGVLFLKNQASACIVSARLYLTGVGSSGHVVMDNDRLGVVNEFLSSNPSYGYIKFHTHSKGTVRDFGEYYASNFSQGDIECYNDLLSRDSDFIGMLVTPVKMLVYGSDNPELIVYKSLSGVKRDSYPSSVEAGLRNAQEVIEERLGRKLGNFNLHVLH